MVLLPVVCSEALYFSHISRRIGKISFFGVFIRGSPTPFFGYFLSDTGDFLVLMGLCW